MWKRDFIGALYPEWEGKLKSSDENRRPVLLGDHKGDWCALEEVRKCAKELTMHAWKEDVLE